MIDSKYFLYGGVTISFFIDIFQDGLMSVGFILGCLVGMMIITQWRIKEDNEKEMNQNGKI